MARRKGKTSPFSGANVGAASPAIPARIGATAAESGTTKPHRRRKHARSKHQRRG